MINYKSSWENSSVQNLQIKVVCFKFASLAMHINVINHTYFINDRIIDELQNMFYFQLLNNLCVWMPTSSDL